MRTAEVTRSGGLDGQADGLVCVMRDPGDVERFLVPMVLVRNPHLTVETGGLRLPLVEPRLAVYVDSELVAVRRSGKHGRASLRLLVAEAETPGDVVGRLRALAANPKGRGRRARAMRQAVAMHGHEGKP